MTAVPLKISINTIQLSTNCSHAESWLDHSSIYKIHPLPVLDQIFTMFEADL